MVARVRSAFHADSSLLDSLPAKFAELKVFFQDNKGWDSVNNAVRFCRQQQLDATLTVSPKNTIIHNLFLELHAYVFNGRLPSEQIEEKLEVTELLEGFSDDLTDGDFKQQDKSAFVYAFTCKNMVKVGKFITSHKYKRFCLNDRYSRREHLPSRPPSLAQCTGSDMKFVACQRVGTIGVNGCDNQALRKFEAWLQRRVTVLQSH